MSWVELAALKTDLGIDSDDTRDDVALQQMLDAACAFVQRVRPEFDYAGDLLSGLPVPPADLVLGTIRLASRWYTRKRSPDGLIQMAELGAARVPSIDPDIERQLGIGRFRKSVIA